MRLAPAVVTIILLMAGCSRQLPPGEHNNFHPYSIEHATLHLEYFGDVRGSEDLYIDSFGNHEVHVINSALITDKGFRPTITYTIRDRENLTIVDSVLRIEAKILDHSMDSIYHLLPSDVPTPEEEFATIFGGQAYKLAGDTTVLGLHAHVWQHAGTPGFLLEWHGIVVGNETNAPGQTDILRLISVDTTTPIDPALFTPPSGFPVRDLTKMKPGQPPPPLSP